MRSNMARSGKHSRRDFLRFMGASAAGLTLGGIATYLPFQRAEFAQSIETDTALLEVSLRAVPTEISILPGGMTRVWTYQGEVLQGDPAALQFLPDSSLGPIFRVRRGQNIRIQFTNELPEESIVHW